jgi:N-acetylglutamate synthase-like GNAT family acetyltransferase
MQPGLIVRQAIPADYASLTALLETAPNLHRHLDWRPPLDWLGREPFFLVEQNKNILAALACPPDPANIAWIRLFAVHSSLPIQTAWNMLYPLVKAFNDRQPEISTAGIIIFPWFGDLLKNAGFRLHQEIVVLEWDNILPPPVYSNTLITIRTMEPPDLLDVARVDHLAFDPLWQNSQESLELALQQSSCATIAELAGEIVGYQISTSAGYSAHLARLAVLPEMQKRSIGYWLVRDLLERFSHQELYRVTVNTQDNNLASLALYQKLGFWLTGDRFQVLAYP